MNIYLFRHGRTFFNQQHRFTGWKNSRLSPAGFKDAKAIASQLKSKKIDLAFTSDLIRAQQTLREVLKYHRFTKILVDKRLRERSYGSLQGRSHQAFIKREGKEDYKTLLHWHKIDHLNGKERGDFIRRVGEAELKVVRRSYHVRPPRGESVQDVEKRVNSFLKDLFKILRKQPVNIAISAHGNSIRPLRRYFEQLSIAEMMQIEQPFDRALSYRVRV